MVKKSVRVQLYDEDQRALSDIAYAQGCIYNQKGNLSLLLMQIAQGRLEVRQVNSITENKLTPNLPLVGMQLTTPASLNGVIAKVAEKLAKYSGNIYYIKARDLDPVVSITFTMPKDSNLNDLITALRQIKVRDVLEFNRVGNLEYLLEVLDPEKKRLYKLLKQQEYSTNVEKNLLDNFIEEYLDKNLVTDIALAIGLKLEVKNISGTLAKLSYEIASRKISILEIDQTVGLSEERNIINLVLGFYPLTRSEPIAEIKNIQNFARGLEKLDYIEKVHQFAVEFA